MNSSNVGDGAPGFSYSNENKSDFSFNPPSILPSGSENAALDSASALGLSTPRLGKLRKQSGSLSHYDMSPALLDTGAPVHTLQIPPGRHPLQNPNPNGQFSSPFSFNLSGFHSNNLSHTMNSSNVGDRASGFSNSNENKSDVNFNPPSILRSGSEKAALGSASALGLSRPRLVKVRKQSGPRSASTDVLETRFNPGFNPFRPVSENSNSVPSGLEKSDKNEAFVFGASRSDSSANLDSGKWGSSGSLDKEVIDDMWKLKIGGEKENMNADEGLDNRVCSSSYENAVSELLGGMRKLKIGGSEKLKMQI